MKAQDSKGGNGKYKYKRLAEHYFLEHNYYSALDNYLLAHEGDASDASITYGLAETYANLREYRLSQNWYEVSMSLDSAQFPLAKFKLANMKMMCGDYANALLHYQTFAKNYTDSFSEQYKMLAKQGINNCRAALLSKCDSNLLVARLSEPINTSNSDFAPVVTENGTLLFSSIQMITDSVSDKKSKNKKQLNRIHLFVLMKDSAGHAQRVPFEPNLFKGNAHYANAAFSPDGQKLFFTQCEEDKSGTLICSIWISIKEQGKWNNPRMLGPEVNQTSFSSTHPNVGHYKKDEVLFFSSNRPGGQGGKDIWFSVIKSNTLFLPATNLGTKINTSQDEVTPWYNEKESALYFSSSGWQSFGGLDVMKAEGVIGRWKSPMNLGRPINSSCDDFYFIQTKEDSSGYLVSNRSSSTDSSLGETCCDDIFRFAPKKSEFIDKSLPVFAVMGNVYDRDDESHTSIAGSIIHLFPDSTSEMFRDTTRISKPFFFLLHQEKKYLISASHIGFDSASVEVSTIGMHHSDTLFADIYLERNPRRFKPSMKIEEEKTYTLKNILYDYDKASLRKKSKDELDSLYVLLQKIPNAIIELSSHTDSCGSDEYNMKLSQRRAESAVNYLKEKGIPSERLVAKGYGETKFVAPNSNADGTDNPEGRQLNRRTDFRIVGDLKNTKIKYE